MKRRRQPQPQCTPRVCAYFHGGPSEGGYWWVKSEQGVPPFTIQVPVMNSVPTAVRRVEQKLPPPELHDYETHLYSLASAIGSEAEYVYEGMR